MQRWGLRVSVPSHRAGKRVPGTAQRASLGLVGGGGWSLIKGPRFFISKVFDLQAGAKAPCRMNAVICLVAGEAGTGTSGRGG